MTWSKDSGRRGDPESSEGEGRGKVTSRGASHPGVTGAQPAGAPDVTAQGTPENCSGGHRGSWVCAQPSCPLLAEVNAAALGRPCTHTRARCSPEARSRTCVQG